MLKIIPFNISKHYIFFNTPLYNIPNIKHLICFSTSLKYYFLYYFLIFFIVNASLSLSFFLSLSLCIYFLPNKNTQPITHGHCQPPPLLENPSHCKNETQHCKIETYYPLPLPPDTTTHTYCHNHIAHNLKPQPPKPQTSHKPKIKPQKNLKPKTKSQTQNQITNKSQTLTHNC